MVLYPVGAAEEGVEAARESDHHGATGEKPAVLTEPGIRDVLAVEAGDSGRNRR